MPRRISGLSLAGALCAVLVVHAQSPTPMTSHAAGTGAGASRTVTVSGCLTKDTNGRYMLTAATSSNRSSAGPTTWTVAGHSDLKKHVGHRIQVVGRTTWDSAKDSRPTPDAAFPGTTTGTTIIAPGPAVDVRSLKVLANTCA
jgi:hypothetical protein